MNYCNDLSFSIHPVPPGICSARPPDSINAKYSVFSTFSETKKRKVNKDIKTEQINELLQWFVFQYTSSTTRNLLC